MSLETQQTIVLHSAEYTENEILSTCQIDPIKPIVELDRLSDRDLSLLFALKNTKNENYKKVFETLYFAFRIRRIMPVKVVYLEEILLESNSELIYKMLAVHHDLVKENDHVNMKSWIGLLSVYGMTWDIVHSLYVHDSIVLGKAISKIRRTDSWTRCRVWFKTS